MLARVYVRLVTSRRLLLTAVGLFAFSLAMLTTISRGRMPAPRIHDEFSYLLAGDTFARGRLTNPAHPFWEHFESFHILQRPTYATKYPPAQGMFLAAGQVLTGQPIVGVWLSYALMCVAISWMLLAWVRPRWALWGGIFVALWFVGAQSTGGYWARSFWGGAVAVIGGALLFGGVRRLTSEPRVVDALLTGVGLGILANSRPFEGLLVSIIPGIALAVWFFRASRPSIERRLTRAIIPLAGTLAVIGSWMGYYNHRVTGSALTLPYAVYERTYASHNPFVVRKGGDAPVYRNDAMRQFYSDERHNPRGGTSLGRTIRDRATKIGELKYFFVPIYVLLLLTMIPWALRDRRNWVAAGSLALGGVGVLITPWTWAHYAAPVVPPAAILLVTCARRMNVLRTRRARTGVYLTRVVLATAALSAMASTVGTLMRREKLATEWESRRARLLRQLEATPDRHIVLVSYGPKHSANREWVYNRADIDGSQVVIARSMGVDRDERLLRYFSGRKAWILAVNDDELPFVLRPYSAPMSQ